MTIENGVLTGITLNEEKEGHIVIPDGVTSIGKFAFVDFTSLTSVTIPDSVTSIGDLAFYRCYGLTNVTIPDSVTSIGESAFEGCTGLTGVTIGNGVKSIGDLAFYRCYGLTSVHYAGDIARWCGISFGYSSNPVYYAHHLYIDGEEVTDLVIPDSVTSIGNFAFRDCTGLTSVTIPDSVTSIGESAFEGCTGLTGVTIPNSVTSMGERAFSGCTKLKTKSANFKAFEITPSGKLKCLDKTYKERHKSFAKGDLKLCKNGIHYCTNLFENFNYYCGELDKDIAIYECDVSDENIGEEGTSKRCARWIVPKRRLYREDVIRILNGGE